MVSVWFDLVFQNESENDPNCKSANCDDDDTNEIPDIYLPPNKRFWLITSVLAHLADEDIPVLQERLADIYRIAFAKYDKLFAMQFLLKQHLTRLFSCFWSIYF